MKKTTITVKTPNGKKAKFEMTNPVISMYQGLDHTLITPNKNKVVLIIDADPIIVKAVNNLIESLI